MKIPSTLPITAEQSRAARFQLGLTQANVIEQSSLAGYKLKQFETGRFVPDMPYLESLRAFYEQQGISFNDDAVPAAVQEKSATPGASMVQPISGQRFIVAIAQEVADPILERMDSNDERIAVLIKQTVGSGFLSDYNEETENALRELYQTATENYLLFRVLQGRNIVAPVGADQPVSTIADVLARFQSAEFMALRGQAMTGQANADAPTEQEKEEV